LGYILGDFFSQTHLVTLPCTEMQQQSKAESDVHRFNWNMLTRGQVQGDQIRRIFAQSAIVFGDFSAIFRRFFGDFSAIFRRLFSEIVFGEFSPIR
jgi:hypothetical protein